MNLRTVVLVAACTVAFGPSASARTAADGEQVRVTFTNGRVTVIADNATVTEILQEWARVGGSKFVNAEKIPSKERITIRLENETEVRALGVLLRSAAGYMVAPRVAGMTGSSSVGRVLIVPVSQAASLAEARPSDPSQPNETPTAPPNWVAGPPRPDDDGPTRQVPPPPAPSNTNPMQVLTAAPPSRPAPNAPIGQATPLGGAQIQTAPGVGPTSAQPGAVIPGPARPGGGRPLITPTQPRPGGGGG